MTYLDRPRRSAAGIAALAAVLAGCGTVQGSPTGSDAVISTIGTRSTTAAPTTTSSVPPAREPRILVFTATGTAKVDSITYVLDGQTYEEQAVTLPWRKSLTVPVDGGRHEWSLTMKHRAGTVEILSILDGKVLTTGYGSGTGTGTASLGGGF
ncbi:hypothetical protein [Actinokineospora sp.]|uniref:hypothetical protein n=1 Tax=Actinokineospora sp. TaxID=1872133 RepID=UPI004037836C